MNEDFVTYEQDLALMKLGFKEYCLYHYSITGMLFSNSNSDSEGGGIYVEDLVKSYNKKDNDYIDAPTLAQAQKWLREEKNLIVESFASFFKPSGFDKVPFTWELFDWSKPNSLIKVGDDHYKYPEEALSAAITECLKLLE